MRIFIEYKEAESDIQDIKVSSAKYLSDYAIRIRFNDGLEKLVDGNLNWNDYELIFPVWDLYNGIIEA